MNTVEQKERFKCALYYTLDYFAAPISSFPRKSPYDYIWHHRHLPIAVQFIEDEPTEIQLGNELGMLLVDEHVIFLPEEIQTEDEFVDYMITLAVFQS